MTHHFGTALLAVLLAPMTLRAQEQPATAPTRDVDVVYRAVAGGQPVEQRSRFAASQHRIRIDTPSPGLYVIVDRAERTMEMVSSGDQSVLDMPYDPTRAVGGVPADRAFTRLGDDVVANTQCTEWQTADTAGRPLAVCLTADGLLLRARAGANVLVQAVRVTYGPIDPSVFAIPATYEHRAARTR